MNSRTTSPILENVKTNKKHPLIVAPLDRTGVSNSRYQPFHLHTVVADQGNAVARARFCQGDGSWVTGSYFRHLNQVAVGNANVHICGETGTGKQIAAAMIHVLSGRSADPLITVDCAAHHKRSMRSEGIEDGQTVNAKAAKTVRRWFQLAGKGTLILDDIRQLGLDLQERLLRVIKQATGGVGGKRLVKAPYPRIITTAHLDLQACLGNGTVRAELYDHLHPVPIKLKPLRHCKQDLAELANYYFNYHGNRPQGQVLPDSIMRQLLNYDWPGNLYELQNTIQRYLAYDEIIFLNVNTDFDEEKTN